jgi:trans-aconitate 2-methyltransferase
VHETSFYYDVLAPATASLDIWVTEYIHVMSGAEAIAEWYKSTGMRPFLDALATDAHREEFTSDYLEAIRRVYAPRADGRVLFPFRRLFMIAVA